MSHVCLEIKADWKKNDEKWLLESMLQVFDTTHSWVVAPPSETAFVFFFLLLTCDVQQSIGATLNMLFFLATSRVFG